ncbi:competence/damage-inducible protein A [Carnobacteriaceae bacterium zg-ZUI78]|nr:competence/damage-inducible protein A [Carnobacteriaceae bacterium zg-ZUI78]
MKAEIITVGTELLLGETLDTNTHYIANVLKELSIPTYFHTSVGDNIERIRSLLNIASKRSDLVILSGGLGPTKDDLTKDALAEHLQETLLLDDKAVDKIKHHFHKIEKEMPKNNLRQARYIENSHILKNHNGLAIGMVTTKDNVMYAVLPGPPSEMTTMVEKELLPFLKEKIGGVFVSKTLRFTNIGESALAEKISAIIDTQSNPTIAIYAYTGDVTVRLTANGRTTQECDEKIKQTEALILEPLKPYFYGYDHQTLADVVIALLKEKHYTLSVAESLTGGLCQSKLVSVSGASDVFSGGVVTYQTSAKEKILCIPSELLLKYGTISHECAMAMAQNVKALYGSDIGLSFTGIADEHAIEDKASGTVYIGIAMPNKEPISYCVHFNRGRNANRELSAIFGLNKLRELLEEKGEHYGY